MKGFLIGILTVVALVFLTFFGFAYHKLSAEVDYKHDRIEEQTSYDNRKQVEDTARATIVNYNNYVDEYNIFKEYCEDDNYNDGKCTRADNSRASANKAANSYNENIQKNKYLFEGNLPTDIPETLATI